MSTYRITSSLLAAVAAVTLAACEEEKFTKSMVLGGQTIPASVLEEGRIAFTHYCRACHGDAGDGMGPAAPAYRPAPRDLTKGVYKFTSTRCEELPPDADFERILRRGLHGTPMLAWDMSDGELHAIIQYLKTFAPVAWQKVNKRTGEPRRPGTPVAMTPDPWAGRAVEAQARGAVVYHAVAECNKCHPSYATKEEIASYRAIVFEEKRRQLPDLPPPEAEFRADPLPSDELKRSADFADVAIPPPDFTFRELRSISPDDDALQTEDLHRVIYKGVCGTAMTAWGDVLTNEDLWAVIHYTKRLYAMRGTAEALALKEKLLP